MRRLLVALLGGLGLLLAALPAPAEACGGLFCTDTPVEQAAERIIFAVDREAGKITAYVQINYTGDADGFSWVVPVPSNPQVDVATMDSFAELSELTQPRLIFPPPPDCFEPAVTAAADNAGGDVNVLQQSAVGPYNFAVIEDSDPAALIAWLRDNGYKVTPEMEPLVKVYTDQGMKFLAMKLKGDKGVQDIQPVALTYDSQQPTIPIRLTAVAANPNMSIITWIFADQQAFPANMTRLQMRKNDLALTDMFGNHNYNELRSGALDQAKGHAFVVEFAQPTSSYSSSDPLIAELSGKYRYLTRLYGEMSPEEMTIDPAFDFSDELGDVSNVIDMSSRNSPYNCEEDVMYSVRRQQIDASKGNRATPEEATANLRRGPLRIVSLIAVLGILALIWWLARRPRRTA